jgi:hypothetical protein
MQQGRGLTLWMAGWRPPDPSLHWRDERNRPLRFVGTWFRGQPNFHDGAQWQLAIGTGGPKVGWNDWDTQISGLHACIEWGEEYESKPPN